MKKFLKLILFSFVFLSSSLYAKEQQIYNRYNVFHCTLQKFGSLDKLPYYQFYDLCIDGDLYIFLITKNTDYKSSHIKQELIKTGKKCSCYIKKKKNVVYIY